MVLLVTTRRDNDCMLSDGGQQAREGKEETFRSLSFFSLSHFICLSFSLRQSVSLSFSRRISMFSYKRNRSSRQKSGKNAFFPISFFPPYQISKAIFSQFSKAVSFISFFFFSLLFFFLIIRVSFLLEKSALVCSFVYMLTRCQPVASPFLRALILHLPMRVIDRWQITFLQK